MHRTLNVCTFRSGLSLFYVLCYRLSLLWQLRSEIARLFCPKKELFETKTSSHSSCHEATRTDSIVVTQVKRYGTVCSLGVNGVCRTRLYTPLELVSETESLCSLFGTTSTEYDPLNAGGIVVYCPITKIIRTRRP